ncbi:basic proline-rich protein-like [Monodon monoceros]|uniref:basic proline-rich protein-like n=1 Tax=Monodon monoceros TaxID=40151 RepID=UPI0010F468FF|nr:basic proline-rich protein-like [Monodon monoceros]
MATKTGTQMWSAPAGIRLHPENKNRKRVDPERCGPAGVPAPPGRRPLACPGENGKGEEEPSVPGAENWDFVGQLNRHPHLARKDPALSSRASRIRAAAPTGFLGLDPAARFPGALLIRDSGFSPSGVPQRRHLARPTSTRGLRDQPPKGYTTPSARRRPGRRGAGRDTELGWGKHGNLAFPHPPTPPVERKSYAPRNFAAIPRRAREAQLRAAWVTCAQIRRAQGRPGRSHRRPRPPAPPSPRPSRGSWGAAASRTRRPDVPGATRAPGRGPGPRSTRPGPGGSCCHLPEEHGPGTAGRGVGRRDPSKEGCAPHGSRRADTASARPHRLPEPGGRAPPRPALRPPLGAPAPAPGRGTLSSLRHPREDTRAGWGPHRRPFSLVVRAAPGIESGRGLPDSTVSSAFLPVTQPFPPPSSSNFPFSSSDRSEPQPALPPAKAGAESPLPAALLPGRVAGPAKHSCGRRQPPHLEPGAGLGPSRWQTNEKINLSELLRPSQRQGQAPASYRRRDPNSRHPPDRPGPAPPLAPPGARRLRRGPRGIRKERRRAENPGGEKPRPTPVTEPKRRRGRRASQGTASALASPPARAPPCDLGRVISIRSAGYWGGVLELGPSPRGTEGARRAVQAGTGLALGERCREPGEMGATLQRRREVSAPG